MDLGMLERAALSPDSSSSQHKGLCLKRRCWSGQRASPHCLCCSFSPVKINHHSSAPSSYSPNDRRDRGSLLEALLVTMGMFHPALTGALLLLS